METEEGEVVEPPGRVVHLDVEDCSKELLRQQSYAIKNQPPLFLAGSLWHETSGANITREALDQ